ncbi:maltase 2-like [Malaya genurostris]|uniref:maltase 2-like n=1 Tax=Malaya genurostris TaxID=325434 RepID=UPI0026F3B2E7|nr:maltase 2-like [Malaya genurostris]XP_058449983.1 maltase 2-like [Malaya genurostris]XP_058449984.1 maltase 2-like [Malaya genurostris]
MKNYPRELILPRKRRTDRILLLALLSTVFYGISDGSSAEVRDWWQDTVFYQIYPRSFMDSDGDGIGDLRGITMKLSHLADAGIGATWLSPIFLSPMVDFGYDIADYTRIQPEYGTMADFEAMVVEATRLGIKIVLDFVPNHSSDQCEWFQRSAARDPQYEDFYVWHDGKKRTDGANPDPPNNWQSVFYGSAWTFHPGRGQFYLHQFTKEQPDLNFRNPAVVERMKEVMRFWLAKGVAGFRIDAVNHLFEVEDFRDEPETGTDRDPLSYGFTHHYYTKDLPEVYEMVYEWRNLLDDWKLTHGGPTRIMMTEAYANITFTMRYYRSADGTRSGSHMPFNFLLITDLNAASSAQDFVFTINKWLTYMPRDQDANWVIGNHDQSRVGSRYGTERIDAINVLLMTLPGIAVTYYGEEIGMVDYKDIPREYLQDPMAANTNKELYMDFSRDPERTPFQWDDGIDAGFSTANRTWLPVNPNYKWLNLKMQQEAEKSHYKVYQQLVKVRRHETLRRGSIRLIAYNDQIVTFVREYRNHDTFVVIVNLGPDQQLVDLTLFPRLSEQLSVVVASSISNFKVGDTVRSDGVVVGAYDALVLLESTASQSRLPFGIAFPLSTVLQSTKDTFVIASIMIALTAGCYHFYRRGGGIAARTTSSSFSSPPSHSLGRSGWIGGRKFVFSL